MNRTGSRAGIIKAIALFLLCFALVACASSNKAALRQASADSTRSFAEGDYAKAIDAHKILYLKHSQDAKVLARYIATVEKVKSAADEARGQGSFATAQGAYRVLGDRWAMFSAFAAKLTFKKTDLEAGIRDCRLALCERQFRQEVEAGSYAKALATYQALLKEYPGDKAVKAGYAKGVGDVKAIGAKALAAKDYASAGKIDLLLLKNLESNEGLAGPAAGGGSSRKDLTDALRLCSSGLTNLGLAEYRKGNLEKAIVIWGELLTFDPGNAEIKKAVETAKAQLGKLKNAAPGDGRGGTSGRGDHHPGR